MNRNILQTIASVLTVVVLCVAFSIDAGAQGTLSRKPTPTPTPTPTPSTPTRKKKVRPNIVAVSRPEGWNNESSYYVREIEVPDYDVVSHEGNGRRVTAATKCCYGDDYLYGENGKPVDYEMAVYWYVQSAEEGDMYGQNNLGYCYEKGKGVPKDLEAAAFWYWQAASKGLAIAQCNMGNCFRYGWGVDVDYEQARYWYRLAIQNGDDEAERQLNRLNNPR